MHKKRTLVAKSEMLIRKPVEEVFEALVDPAITSRFWFTRGSARLETGKMVNWEWEQFGVDAEISVTRLEQNRLIRFEWPADEKGDSNRTVEILFSEKSIDKTFVQVVERGFKEADKHLIDIIAAQTEGWALVLSGLKAWLEHGIELNLISDHKPLK